MQQAWKQLPRCFAEPLPTEDELTRLFGVSRITVRTALAKLAANGLIERRQGGRRLPRD
jgi:DNA-binding GntR family transcriptional regulator